MANLSMSVINGCKQGRVPTIFSMMFSATMYFMSADGHTAVKMTKSVQRCGTGVIANSSACKGSGTQKKDGKITVVWW
jgi:hypothetical protein